MTVDENTPNSEIWIPDVEGHVLPGTYNITVPIQGLIPYREPSRRLRRITSFLRRHLTRKGRQ